MSEKIKTKPGENNNKSAEKGNKNSESKKKRFSWIRQSKITDWILAFTTIAIFGVGFLQWQALKKTNEISSLQLQALQKTDETSRLRDRAFIYFSTPSFTPYLRKDNSIEWIFKIVAHNSGNMPAKTFDIKYADIDSTTKTDIAPVTQATKWKQATTPKTLGPKQNFLFQLFDATKITEDEIKKMKEGSLHKFILAEATYFDGFSQKQRVTKMGVRLNVDKKGAYSFSFTSNHNCTDDDCN
jgi:hypothetical protein